MKQIYSIALVLLVFASCSPKLHYVGNKTRPTDQIDVYVEASSIRKNYDVVGKGYVDYNYTLAGKLYEEKILRKAIEKARANGADAIYFKQILDHRNETIIETNDHRLFSDSNYDRNSTKSIARIGLYRGKEILFLKYR